MIASAKVINQARKVDDFLTVGAAAPLQKAAVTALNFPLSYYDRLRTEYTHRRDCFLGYLRKAGLAYKEPHGAYYVLADVSDLNKTDDLGFCRWLAKEVGVAAVPGSIFFHEPVNHFIRFHFAKKETTLVEAGQRLLRLKEKG